MQSTDVPHYNPAADAAEFIRQNPSIEPKTNKFTLLRRENKDDKGDSHTMYLFYETETGLCHGSVVDGEVFIGLDARSTIRRTFISMESAHAFVLRYLEARAAEINRKLVLVETDGMMSAIIKPGTGIIRAN